MGRTFTKLISEDELAEKLLKACDLTPLPGKTAKETIEMPYEDEHDFIDGAWIPNPKYTGRPEFVVSFLHGGQDYDDDSYPLNAPVFSKFMKDISKVEFDFENVESMGFHKLANDFVYYAFSAGGDWECPIYVIVYWDGSSIRGYIPTDGNPWNTATNKAYGNDDTHDLSRCMFCDAEPAHIADLYGTEGAYCDAHFNADNFGGRPVKTRKPTEKDKEPNTSSDAFNLLKRFGLTEEMPNIEFDIPKIQADIMNRIVKKDQLQTKFDAKAAARKQS